MVWSELLSDSERKLIYKKLPDLSHLGQMLRRLFPDLNALKFPYDSDIPRSSSCFEDALHALQEAAYAIRQIYSYKIWFLEKKDPRNEYQATSLGWFYADDATFRLYASGEHLANGIVFMLEIADEDLKCYQKKRSSRQSVVGHFLKEQKPNDPITKAVNKLADSQEWQQTMKYRERLVHEQPPTVAGLGDYWGRQKRWKSTPTGSVLLIGSDKPEFTVDDLVGFIRPAMFKFTDTLTSAIEYLNRLVDYQDQSMQSGRRDCNLDSV